MGKSYTNYKQARSNFMRSAFEKSAGQLFSNFSGKKKKTPKLKKNSVLSGMPKPLKPLTVTIQFDTKQIAESLRKVAEEMTKSGKMFKVLADAISDAMLKGMSEVVISSNGHYTVIDSYLKFGKRWLMLQALGWIQDPEGGLVSPHTLDIVDPVILNDADEFKRFLDHYLATGKVGEWVPCLYAVPQVEEIALPLDSIRKQLEERISE